jgi:hypothetical protein
MRLICTMVAMSLLSGCAEEAARIQRESEEERVGPCRDTPLVFRDYCPNVKHRLEAIPVSGDLLTAGRVVFLCRCPGRTITETKE